MSYSIRTNLACIGKRNRSLADELGKLPEIRQLETPSSRTALNNLTTIYGFAPTRFDRMFDGMNRIGLPAHRKYCSPLQAVFWMIQDENWRDADLLLGVQIVPESDAREQEHVLLAAEEIAPQSRLPMATDPEDILKQTLDAAWYGETELISHETIRRIVRRLQRQEELEEYSLLVKRHSDRQLQKYILNDYLKKKEVFSAKDWSTIEDALRHSRWKRFYTVADRLNSPELINHYINENFFFNKKPATGVYSTFFEKRAQCTDAAYFSRFMLERAGYRTFMRSVKWNNDPWAGLHTGAGIVCKDGRYLLVANYTGINAISGPFATVENLDRQLSCNRTIVDSRWGAYYPPRCY